MELYNAQNATERDGSPKLSCCKTFSVRYSYAEHVTSTVTPLEIKSWEVLALGWRSLNIRRDVYKFTLPHEQFVGGEVIRTWRAVATLRCGKTNLNRGV